MKCSEGWIGVDLDGTLAVSDTWRGVDHIGAPVPAMLDRVRQWLAEGVDARIFTARVSVGSGMLDVPEGRTENEAQHAREVVQVWCQRYLGRVLPVTCIKDYGMIELWDDRVIQVIPNTGRRADGLP